MNGHVFAGSVMRRPCPDPIRIQMFANSIQPGIVSLFSSTSSEPLSTFSSHADASLPSDSFIHLLDDRSSQPPPLPPAAMVRPHKSEDIHEGYCIDQTVLHMQSPTLTKTFIHCPSLHGSTAKDLALKHPWIYFQVRNLGRPWSFEIGIVDLTGTKGILRCSTFQVYSFFSSFRLYLILFVLSPETTSLETT